MSKNNVRKLQSKKERNLEMYMKYLEGIPLQDIADEYGLTYAYVKNLSSQEKWADRKFTNATEAIEIFNTKFINASEQLIEEFFANDKKAYNLVIDMLNNPECYCGKDGTPSIYKLRQIVETMVILEDRLKDLTGIVTPSELLNAKIRAIQNGISNEIIIEDNFMEALGIVADNVFGDNQDLLDNEINKYTRQQETKNPKYKD